MMDRFQICFQFQLAPLHPGRRARQPGRHAPGRTCQMLPATSSIQRMLNPCSLSHLASDDKASNVWRALSPGVHRGEGPRGLRCHQPLHPPRWASLDHACHVLYHMVYRYSPPHPPHSVPALTTPSTTCVNPHSMSYVISNDVALIHSPGPAPSGGQLPLTRRHRGGVRP